ncbi:basic leucine zipper 61-like [Lycium barbarum]|uniref:basic leucine zipper 61-like n=1 Tax=Lycium barbarum TaxID=112863 RepID=UPI00293EFCC5|nr:basic leucine zipper 61-like [Lycium barbarum]
MAHLPPRAPNMTSNWPDFSLHQKVDNLSPTAHNLWGDEFLDMSSRRGSHRRSMSDSIAFLESPMVEECRRLSSTPGSGGTVNGHEEFERFDDEQQIMSMFNNDVHDMSCSNPSSPSEYINDNEDKSMNNTSNQKMQQQFKSENDEVQSLCKNTEELPAANQNASTNEYSSERVVDPKRIKRILANRQSAQRSRVRKLQYVSELERSVSTLQAEVSVLSPRVAFLDHQRLLLNVDNSALRQKIAALAQDKLFKDAHQEALKREIERLRQIYYQQNLKQMENNGTTQQPLADSEMHVQLVN